MGVLWGADGVSVGVQKKISMGFPLDSYGISMIFLWDFFGISVVFLLDFYAISMGLL